MSVRPQDLVFFAGGECLEKYGTLVKRTSPGEEIVETFDRDSNQYYVDRNGVLKIAGTDVPAVEWLDLDGDGVFETPVLMGEGQRMNGWTYSEQLDQGVYTKTRASISADDTTAPDGESTADKLVEDNTAAETHYLYRATPALTNDTLTAVSLFAKADERSEFRLTLLGKDSVERYAFFDVDVDVDSVGTTSGAVGRIRALADDWRRCTIVADSKSGAQAPGVYVHLSSGSETISYDGDNTSGMHFWGMQPEVDQPFESSYIKTVAATATRQATQFSYPHPFPPQTLTGYVKFRERGSISTTGARVIQLSQSAPYLLINSQVGTYKVWHHNGSTEVGSGLAAGPSIEDTVELLFWLFPTGVIQLHQSINGDAETSSTPSAANALASAWGTAEVWLNSQGASSVGFAAFDAAKIALGSCSYSMDEMRAAA